MLSFTASSFYQCPQKLSIMTQIKEENYTYLCNTATKLVSQGLITGKTHIQILADVKKILSTAKEDLFSTPFVREQQIKDDIEKYRRFLVYLNQYKIIEGLQSISVNVGKNSVSTTVHLIAQKDNDLFAFIILSKKANKSPGGKSIHTSTDTDLHALIAKLGLENSYPRIKICLVFLSNPDDTLGKIGNFIVCKTKKSNIFTLDFEKYYTDDIFDEMEMKSTIEHVLSIPQTPVCFGCDYADLCKKDSVSTMSVIQKPLQLVKTAKYELPTYTENQKKVIESIEGPVLVCAGPGSGKTATVIGRIKNMIEHNIPPEFILAITFTRDAANELLERCRTFCQVDRFPKICTLNSLGYEILRNNEFYVGKLRLLSRKEQMQIIDNLLSASEKTFKGFSYTTKTGTNGIINQLANAINDYHLHSDKFIKINSKKYDSDFYKFIEQYDSAVKSGNYITFDQQISLCIKLFYEHPEVLNSYVNLYKYISVDEYQDINAEQAHFIEMLASHQNICAVGDDDQSIYAFRGGSNSYMLDFKNRYPKSKTFVLKENFRSTEALVDSSRNFIEKSNVNRIPKKIAATIKGGVRPEIIDQQDVDTLNQIVKNLLNEGFSYNDIAILASKNSTLENLYSSNINFSAVLGKAFLVDHPVFKILYELLFLGLKGINHKHIFRLCSLLDITIPKNEDIINWYTSQLSLKNQESQEKLIFISNAISMIQTKVRPLTLSDYVCASLKISGTTFSDALNKTIESSYCKDLNDLFDTFSYMIDFCDDTRIDPDTSNSVLMITNHESKGMEWNVVILIDDFKREDVTDDAYHLYYVAITRAKKRLVILTKDGKTMLNR